MNTKHLKAKILDLAIRGKLVPQDSSEGSAADLLKKIREEKNKLVEQKKIKADKKTSFIIKAEDGRHYEQFADGSLIDVEDEIPFEIPGNWCWCRLREITTILGDGLHGTPKYNKNGDYYFINGNNLENGKIIIKSDTEKVDDAEYQKYKKELNDNTVLVSINGTIGNIAFYNNEKIILGKSACYFNLISSSFKNYIYLLIKTSFFLVYATTNATGSTIKNVSLDTMRNFLLPLPPLSEQKRIVSAIEKAFEQIDIIEKNKLNLKTYIKQTKSKVLDLAIHGKLVEQNPKEGNAFELLEKIHKEKSDLIKQKKIKEDKKSSFIIKAEDGKHYEQFADGTLKDIEDEIPFEEPKGWTWCRINEIAVDMADGPFGSNLKSEHYTTNKEARIIQLSNLSDEGWREENTRYTTIKHATDNISRSIVEPGNIVIAKMMPAGRAMICPDKEQMYVLSSDCVKLVPIEGVYKQFLVRALNSPFFRNRVVDNVQGVTRQRTSISKLRSCYFPLPPFEEQKRIVDKLEQVFKQLDILEKSLGE